MNKKELLAMAEKHQKKANQEYRNYQETGITRYLTSCRKNEDLADALRMAACAEDDHQMLGSILAQMSLLAYKAKAAMRPGLGDVERDKQV